MIGVERALGVVRPAEAEARRPDRNSGPQRAPGRRHRPCPVVHHDGDRRSAAQPRQRNHRTVSLATGNGAGVPCANGDPPAPVKPVRGAAILSRPHLRGRIFRLPVHHCDRAGRLARLSFDGSDHRAATPLAGTRDPCAYRRHEVSAVRLSASRGVRYRARGCVPGPVRALRAGDPECRGDGAPPPGMLAAIAQVESGPPDSRTGAMRPWPWTIDADGVGPFFATKAQAVAAVAALQAQGMRSIDVGCMQVNLMHHPGGVRLARSGLRSRCQCGFRGAFPERVVSPHRRLAQGGRRLPFRHAADRGRLSAPCHGDMAAARADGRQRRWPRCMSIAVSSMARSVRPVAFTGLSCRHGERVRLWLDPGRVGLGLTRCSEGG